MLVAILSGWEYTAIIIAVTFAVRELYWFRVLDRHVKQLLNRDGKDADAS